MTKFDTFYSEITEANNLAPQQNVNQPGSASNNQANNNNQTSGTVNNNQTNSATNNNQTNSTTNNNQTNSATNNNQTNSTTNNNQQKPDFNKLVQDFNNNSVKITTPQDLKKYGINVTV